MKRVTLAVLALAAMGVLGVRIAEWGANGRYRVSKNRPPHETPPWAKVSTRQFAEAVRLGVEVAFENDLGMRFVLIPAGTFSMGAPDSEWRGPAEPERYEIEQPQHSVTLGRAYYVSIYEVTNGQFRQMKLSHRSGTDLDGDQQPVVEVNHAEAAEFATWLSRRDRERKYRLPAEAEWERACRSGSTTPFAFGETITTDQANYCSYLEYGEDGSQAPDESSVYRKQTTEVGALGRNAWGLYDMHGNVAEWCADWCAPYPVGKVVDPLGPPESDAPVLEYATLKDFTLKKQASKARVLRGGHWQNDPSGLRCARRDYAPPSVRAGTVGFRLVSPLPEPSK